MKGDALTDWIPYDPETGNIPMRTGDYDILVVSKISIEQSRVAEADAVRAFYGRYCGIFGFWSRVETVLDNGMKQVRMERYENVRYWRGRFLKPRVTIAECPTQMPLLFRRPVTART